MSDTQPPPDRKPSILPIEWLWKPYIPAGVLTLIDGHPQAGKSILSVDLAARLSAGLALPDGQPPAQPRPVTFVTAEDTGDSILIPRFIAAGGDLHRIMICGGFMAGDPTFQPLQIPADWSSLARRVHERPGGLVVLDPISALFPPEVPINCDQAIRVWLTALAKLANETRSAILILRHLVKSQARRALLSGAGSIGIAGAARSVLLVGEHPDQPDRRVLTHVKSNYARPGPSLAFHIADDNGTARLNWDGPTNLTADDLCRAAAADARSLLAERWLKALLAAGPARAADIEAQAQNQGFGFTTLRMAKKRIGAESRRIQDRSEAYWVWELIHNEPSNPPPLV